MSSTASTYDVNRLFAGIILAASSLILTSSILLETSSLFNLDTVVFGIMTLLYGIMMFASSYVEEEQHFWYSIQKVSREFTLN